MQRKSTKNQISIVAQKRSDRDSSLQSQQQQSHQIALDSTFCRSNSFAVGNFQPSTSDHFCDDAADDTMSNQFLDDLDNLIAVNDTSPHAGQHPALKTVCVVDCNQNTRIIPNSDEAFVLNNDCFVGKVMLLIRTPDVDNHRDPHNLGPVQREVSEYFKGKKRRFEFQFQIKLKHVPEGPLFLGCELEHAIKVGSLTKGLVNLLLAMVRRINPGFHYSWGPSDVHNTKNIDPEDLANGNYEKTHLSFPVEASMDRIVITKEGETPPKLGQELFESNESVKRRRRMGSGAVDWNTSDTFTMCLWSAYADWIKWKSINVPGVSPFSISRVTGTQPIYLCFYEITSCKADEYKKKRPPHLHKHLKIYTRFEFSNEEKTVGGLAESVLGRSSKTGATDHSLQDTDSLSSDFETMSHVSHITT